MAARRCADAMAAPPLSMRFRDWPLVDQTVWERILGGTQRCTALDGPPLAEWSQRHVAVARLDYGRWLRWLMSIGRLEPNVPPAKRLTADLMRGFIGAECARCRWSTIATTIGNLLGVAVSIDPASDLAWMRELHGRLKRRARREDRRPRHIAHAHALYGLGLDAMAGARDVGSDQSQDFRDGLMVAMLAAAPIRISNFAALTIGRHVLRRGDAWHLELAASETKTRQADTWPLPAKLSDPLRFYVERVRPCLLTQSRAASDRLWIADNGRPMSANSIRKAIKRLTEAAFGAPILPHSFRHSAATSFVQELPERAAEAPAILGHRSGRTTERHYILGQHELAARSYAGMLTRRIEAAKSRDRETCSTRKRSLNNKESTVNINK